MRRTFLLVLSALFLAACAGSGTADKTPPYDGTSEFEGVSRARRTVVEESYRWLGVPYAYGGNGRSGVDCSGLVARVYTKVGVRLPRSAREMYGVGRKIDRSQLVPGDLVFFRNTAGSGITHVGIYVGNQHFVHASTRKGVISSGLKEEYYARHYAGARMIIR